MWALQAAEKLFSEGVIPSAARDLFSRALKVEQIPRSRKSGATSG
jgi:hypothetical protein